MVEKVEEFRIDIVYAGTNNPDNENFWDTSFLDKEEDEGKELQLIKRKSNNKNVKRKDYEDDDYKNIFDLSKIKRHSQASYLLFNSKSSWAKLSKSNPNKIYCKICKKELHLSGGSSLFKRHEKTNSHIRNAETLEYLASLNENDKVLSDESSSYSESITQMKISHSESSQEENSVMPMKKCNDSTEDHNLIGQRFAMNFRKMSKDQRLIAERMCLEIMYLGRMNKLHRNSTITIKSESPLTISDSYEEESLQNPFAQPVFDVPMTNMLPESNQQENKFINESINHMKYEDDECDVIGRRLILNLRRMSEKQRLIAEKMCLEIMYYGRMEQLEDISKVTVAPLRGEK